MCHIPDSYCTSVGQNIKLTAKVTLFTVHITQKPQHLLALGIGVCGELGYACEKHPHSSCEVLLHLVITDELQTTRGKGQRL